MHIAHWEDGFKTTEHRVRFAKNISAARMTTRSSIPYVKSSCLHDKKTTVCNKATLERQQEDKMGTKSAKPLLAQFQPQFTMGCIQENRDLCKRFRFFLIFNHNVKICHSLVNAHDSLPVYACHDDAGFHYVMGGKCYVFLMSAYSCDVDQGFRVQGLVTWSVKSETQKTFML